MKAQAILKDENKNYSLIVYDAVRPLHIQQLMWDSLKLPNWQKALYVANPSSISLHNYGAAIDLSITDSLGNEVDMGTAFDYFGIEAHTNKDSLLLATKKINEQQLQNRYLLRRVMMKAGFFPINTEWWHFNYCNKLQASKLFKLIE